MNTIIGCGLFMLGMIAFTAWMLCRAGADDDETKNADFARWLDEHFAEIGTGTEAKRPGE